MPENELYHHGITGMRWGFRRFQNEDGSLTPEGELRYNQGKQKLARGKAAEMYKTKKYKAKLALKQEKQKVKDAAAIAKTAKKEQAKLNAEDRIIRKKPQNMTDEELRNEVNRLAMELDYQKKTWQVEKGKKGPSALDKADDFFERPTGKIVAEVGKSIVTQVASNALTNIIKEKTSAIEKEKLKAQEFKTKKAKSDAKKSKIEAEEKEKEFEAKYGKKDKSNMSEESKSEGKTAADYAKAAYEQATKSKGSKSNSNSSGAKGYKGTAWGKKDKSDNTYNVKDDQYGPVFSSSKNTGSSGSSEKKGFTFDPTDPISSEYMYNQPSSIVKNLSLSSGNSKLLLPAPTDETLKKLGLK